VPVLTIDLDVIEANVRALVDECAAHGLRVTGVTKAVGGQPDVAEAMVRGGVTAIGDSRLEHLAKLQRRQLGVPLVLLRVPERSRAEDVVAVVDVSLNSDLTVLAALSDAAVRRRVVHEVVVMVDLGDLREGVMAHDVLSFVAAASMLPGVRVVGVGTNHACFGGVIPTALNIGRLAALAGEVERVLGHRLRIVSGGNSSALRLIASGQMPPRVNEVRLGEAILLGRETVERQPWPGLRQDAVRLTAEVIELRRKPTVSKGPRGLDALGNRPSFTDRGMVDHALVDLGAVDVEVSALQPVDPGIEILGATSDYMVLDVTAAHGALRVGDTIAFAPGYAALATAATSPYVELLTLTRTTKVSASD